MDDQRLSLYAELINKLLKCPSGEENTILNAHPELLDEGLVAAMQHYSETLRQQGSIDSATILQSLRPVIATFIRQGDSRQEPTSAERQQAYADLIQLLLLCQAGEEQWILGAYGELLDQDFVSICEQVALKLVEQNNQQDAARLRSFAAQLTSGSRTGNPSHSNEQEAFLVQLLSTVVESKGDPANVYPLLSAHLPLLNIGLTAVMSDWFTGAIEQVDQGQRNGLAAVLVILGNLMQEYPLGSPRSNQMIAIEAYFNALRIYTEEQLPQDYAMTKTNLGSAYTKLTPFAENPKQLIKNAIEAYTSALRIYTEDEQPQDWSTTNNNLGAAYSKLAQFSENPKQLIEKAIAAYTNALRVRTEAELPDDWAATTTNLGNAYGALAPVSENPKQLFEKAIEAYSNALRVYTECELPQAWAATNMNLGNAYCGLAPFSESSKQQIQKAIEAINNALRVYKETELPHDYAIANTNLGNAFKDLAPFSENPKQQIEKAIDAYTNALRVRTEAELPQAWAATNARLGNSFKDLAPFSENPKQLIEKAIEAYTNALRVRTEAELPQDWAATNTSLGNAYGDLAPFSENPKQLFEKAIEAYTNALRFFSEAERPQDYAVANANLGTTYTALAPFSENPKQQFDKAIEAFSNALQVFTEAKHPQDWATTNNNLGATYDGLSPFSENPKQQIENAIEAYTNALRVRTEAKLPQAWATTNNNLGTAYSNLSAYSENPKQLFEKAIEVYTNALRVFTEAQWPHDWATTNNNLGTAYSELAPFSESPKQQIENAIEAYTNALRIRDSVTRSADCLQTAWNLGNLGFKNNQQDIAIEGYTLAINAVENLRSVAIDPKRKAEIVAQAIEVYANLVQVYVDAEQYDKALEVADRSKSRNLVELLATKDLYPKGDIPPEVLRRLDALRGSIARAERQLNKTNATHGPTAEGGSIARGDTRTLNLGPPKQQDVKAATDRLLRDKQQLEHLIQVDIQPIDPTFSLSQKVQPLTFEQFQAALPDGRTALVSWYVAGDRLVAFLVSAQAAQPTCHVYPEDTLKNIIQALKSYIQTYLQEKEEWAQSLPKALMEFARILEIDSLARKISEMAPDADQLILVPHRFLHLLPLHCLSLSESHGTLLDRFARGVRFAPSLQVLQLVQQRPQTGLDSLFAIENPTRDLPYTDLEVEAIHPLFGPQPTVLRQQAATKAALERSSSTLASSTCLHFSCHGTFNFAQPQLSALILADSHLESQPDDADPDRYLPQLDGSALDLTRCLTLLDLFQLDLRQARLVTLSACETGLSEINSLSDEFVGLSSGFLYAGCNSVIGTLWTVSDISTGLLMAEFYRLLKQQEQTQRQTDVAIALKQAQHWLRHLTCEQAVARIEHALPSLPEAVRPNYTYDIQELKRRHQPTDRLYSSPFYWAAFCAVGQ
ncbi:CHAT domain-containing protein [Synechococcus sp. Lug-A]|uniref:CHAT domain-containing tetratricopeptide repeat protein n=1 Tax=Synechococcus sp. Lug-A TaxID=2823740 RepID=UPI0020CD28E6|nr:CHAT domain-containing protein [Synechococcus sp. Lug-A]MCP9848138.1 CHAT domain-containing protein [Synechococcus sp. Lug-A]